MYNVKLILSNHNMTPCQLKVMAKGHLLYDNCPRPGGLCLMYGCGKHWAETMEEWFTFQCMVCWKINLVTISGVSISCPK